MMFITAQLCLAVFSLLAIGFSQCRDAGRRRYSPVFGLLSQPFWLMSTWQAGQWGMFALSVLYTAIWGSGFYLQWVRRT